MMTPYLFFSFFNRPMFSMLLCFPSFFLFSLSLAIHSFSFSSYEPMCILSIVLWRSSYDWLKQSISIQDRTRGWCWCCEDKGTCIQWQGCHLSILSTRMFHYSFMLHTKNNSNGDMYNECSFPRQFHCVCMCADKIVVKCLICFIKAMGVRHDNDDDDLL